MWRSHRREPLDEEARVGNPEGGHGAGAVRTEVARRPNIRASLVDEVGYETQTRAGEGGEG
jgi:hypothetical protein